MDYKEMSPEFVDCPLCDEKIYCGECVENSDTAEGTINEGHMPEKYKAKANWRDICKNCKWHNY